MLLVKPIKPFTRFATRSYSTQQIKRPPYKVLFFGTDLISVQTLEALYLNQHVPEKTELPSVVSHIEVVTRPLTYSEPHPVAKYAKKHNIPTHFPVSINDFEIPATSKFDLGIVVSYGQLIPNRILDAFTIGGINMHPSLLPKYRGAAPIVHTLLNNEKETGVTILELSRNKFDAGKILYQEKTAIPSDMTYMTLSKELASHGAKCVLKTLVNLQECMNNATTQDESQATKAPKIYKEMGNIDWNESTPEDVYIKWKALGDLSGIFTHFALNGTRVVLKDIMPPTTTMAYKNWERFEKLYAPGQLKFDIIQNLLFIKCKTGWIATSRVSVDGKTTNKAVHFANGYHIHNAKEPRDEFKFVKIEDNKN